MLHNIYNQQKNKQKDNKEKPNKTTGNIDQKSQVNTKSRDTPSKLLNKDNSFSFKKKEISNTKINEEELKILKQDVICENNRDIDITDIKKKDSNHLLSILVKYGLGNMINLDNLDMNSPSSSRDNNLNEGKIVYPAFKKIFEKSLSIKEELTHIETKKLKNLFSEINKMLVDKEREITLLKKGSYNPNSGLLFLNENDFISDNQEFLKIKNDIDFEKINYEEKINNIRKEKEIFVESFAKVYEEKVEKFENLNKLLLEEKERLRRELSSIKNRFEEEKSEIINSYEIRLANLKKELNNIKVENNTLNYEYITLKQECKQIFSNKDIGEFQKASSHNPSSDLKPSFIPRPSSNQSEKLASKNIKQSMLYVKESSPKIKEKYGLSSPIDKTSSPEKMIVNNTKQILRVERRIHQRNLSAGVSTLESTEDKANQNNRKPFFILEHNTLNKEVSSQFYFEISRDYFEYISKGMIEKEKEIIKLNEITQKCKSKSLKDNNLIKEYSSKTALIEEFRNINEKKGNESRELMTTLKEIQEENVQNKIRFEEEIYNINMKLNHLLDINECDNELNIDINKPILEKLNLAQIKMSKLKNKITQIESLGKDWKKYLIITEECEIFIQGKSSETNEDEIRKILEEKIGEQQKFEEKEKIYEKQLSELKNNLEKIRQEKKSLEFHFSLNFEENLRIKSEKTNLDDKYQKSLLENKRLLEELQKLNSNFNIDNKFNEKLKEKNEYLLNEKEISTLEIKRLNETMNKYSNQLEDFKNDNESLKTENRCLQKQIDYYISVVSEKENNIILLNDSLKEYNNVKQENLNLKILFNEVNQISNKQTDKEELQYSKFYFELIYVEKISKISLSNMIDELNSLLKDKEKEIIEYQNKCYAYSNELEEMKNKLNEMISTNISKQLKIPSQEITLFIPENKKVVTQYDVHIISLEFGNSNHNKFLNCLEINCSEIEIIRNPIYDHSKFVIETFNYHLINEDINSYCLEINCSEIEILRNPIYDHSKFVIESFNYHLINEDIYSLNDLEIINTCFINYQGAEEEGIHYKIIIDLESKTKVLSERNEMLELEVNRLKNLNNTLLIHVEEIRKKDVSYVETINTLKKEIEKINQEKQGNFLFKIDEMNLKSEYKFSLDFLKEKLDEHKDLNSEIESLQKENRELKERYSVSGIRDSLEMSNYRAPTQSSQEIDEFQVKNFDDNFQIQSFHHSEDFKSRETVYKLSELTRSLLLMCLFTMKILDNSLTIYQLNDKILNDFSFYMKTIFVENESYNMQKYTNPSTIAHEYLEDIFLKINNKYVSEKYEKIKGEKTNSIDANDLDTEFMFFVSKDIYKNNLLTLERNKISSKIQSNIKQEFFPSSSSFLVSFLRSIFKIKDETVRSFFQEKEIKNDLQNRLHSFKKKAIDQTYQIVENCKNCIKNGILYFNNKEIYNFRNSYLNIISHENDLCVLEQIDNNEKLNMIINTFKQDQKILNSIDLCQSFNKQSLELSRFFMTMINYLGNITNLALTQCNFSEKQFAMICNLLELRHISFLDLSSNKITDNYIVMLSKVLENNHYLKYLNLSKNLITSKGANKLADTLNSNKIIEKLFLPGNSIDIIGLKSLVDTLIKNNRTLQYLDIAGNQISGEYLTICRLLKNNNQIRYLNLSSTVYDVEGLAFISQALEVNEGLKILYLEKSQLNSEKLSSLFKRFDKANLYELHLNYNFFREKEIQMIINMLERNKYLKLISLRNCGFSINSLIEIVNKLNNGIEKIDVRENKFDLEKESVNLLINAAKNKKFQILISINDKNYAQLFSNCDRFILY